jgi:hypothetical protein
MREVNKSLVIEADRTKVRRHVVGRLPIVVCLLTAVLGFTLLYVRSSGARAPRPESELHHADATKSDMQSSGVLTYAHARGVRTDRSQDGLWRVRAKSGRKRSIAHLDAGTKRSQALSLNETAVRNLLSRAPIEFKTRELPEAGREAQVTMTLPMPDGTFSRFRIEESPVMAAELAAHFPDIRTYRGRSIDDPTVTTRLDITPAGFHAIVLSSRGTVIVEPTRHATGQYVSYDISQKQGDAPQAAGSFSCVVLGAEQAAVQSKQLSRQGSASFGITSGATLRTYRLALAATAEFTQTYGGGTVGGTLSALTTLINAVNAIYERDLAIHLTLVGNETSIIFTNAATDGYTSNDANALLNQNQAILDQRIGAANYDLGMVMDGRVFGSQPGFIFNGGANYQSTCINGRKGTAVSILRSTEPSSVNGIYVAAHELAHMFGALHTFNSTLDDCGPSRFSQNSYEVGSGSTLMGYRGGVLPDGSYYPICSGDDLRSTDTYFHAATIEQIFNSMTFGNASACGVLTNTGNTPPNVDAGANYTIPANTPFTLTASGSDAEGDALTFCWEQFDLGAAGPPHTDNGNRPIFRSFAPVSSPARTFPQLSDILSGTQTFGESLPTTDRTMNFRVTVRDNHASGGGVNIGATSLTVVSNSGPFIVTQPTAGTSWTAGSTQTVTWDVANTSSAPISSASVRVLLSVDGGNSFPFTLASGIPNTGTATITVPNTPTSSARVKVEAADNIFFNISPSNFTIATNTTSPPTLLTEPNTNRAIALDAVTFVRDPFSVPTSANFSSDQRTLVMLFAIGLELMPGESISVVTAEAEDSAHKIFPMPVEYVGKISNFDWCTQVNVRLPDGLAGAGDVLVSVKVRGAVSNKVLLRIQ